MIFDPNTGELHAMSGNTFHASGLIPHPLQKAGVIPMRGQTWTFRGVGSSVAHALIDLAKVPIPSSGEETH